MYEDKYSELIAYGESLGMHDVSSWEEELSTDINHVNDDIFGVYTVQPGDSLSKISKWLFGDPMKYMEIFNLNTDTLKNPDSISEGQKLKLPNV